MTKSPENFFPAVLHVRPSSVGNVLAALCAVVLVLQPWRASVAETAGKTVRLFTVGNSFSQNAVKYLSDITSASGHKLVLKAATIGGCPLEKHWVIAGKAEADANDPEGKPYGGKSLRELLQSGTWDFVTMQQYSMISPDIGTYRPFARNLHDYIKKYAPGAEVLMHQTWAYRVDDPRFNDPTRPYTQKQMYEGLTHSYRTIAGELGIRVIPTGDAFYRADTDSLWGYKPDAGFDRKTAVAPALPEQGHSLHAGWRWIQSKTTGKVSMNLDGHHANDNGCYLAGCVWFEFLFGESVVGNKFTPKGMNAETAAYLQKTAHEAVGASAGRGVGAPR